MASNSDIRIEKNSIDSFHKSGMYALLSIDTECHNAFTVKMNKGKNKQDKKNCCTFIKKNKLVAIV